MRTPLVVVVVMLSAAAAVGQSAGLPDVAGIGAPTVYDARGTAVGQLVSIDDRDASANMLLEIKSEHIVVSVKMKRRADGVYWSNPFDIAYTGLDCTGDAYVWGVSSFGDYIAAIDRNEDLLLGDVTQPQPYTTFLSVFHPDGTCEDHSMGFTPAIMLTKVVSLKATYKTPLKVGNMYRARAITNP